MASHLTLACVAALVLTVGAVHFDSDKAAEYNAAKAAESLSFFEPPAESDKAVMYKRNADFINEYLKPEPFVPQSQGVLHKFLKGVNGGIGDTLKEILTTITNQGKVDASSVVEKVQDLLAHPDTSEEVKHEVMQNFVDLLYNTPRPVAMREIAKILNDPTQTVLVNNVVQFLKSAGQAFGQGKKDGAVALENFDPVQLLTSAAKSGEATDVAMQSQEAMKTLLEAMSTAGSFGEAGLAVHNSEKLAADRGEGIAAFAEKYHKLQNLKPPTPTMEDMRELPIVKVLKSLGEQPAAFTAITDSWKQAMAQGMAHSGEDALGKVIGSIANAVQNGLDDNNDGNDGK